MTLGSFDPATKAFSLLYHPRTQDWGSYFELRGAHVFGKTPEGRTTVWLLQINQPERITERQRLMAEGHYP